MNRLQLALEDVGWQRNSGNGDVSLEAIDELTDAIADNNLLHAAPALLHVAEQVAVYYDGIDAPLGDLARAAIEKAKP